MGGMIGVLLIMISSGRRTRQRSRDQLLVYYARALDFVQEICHRINALPSINRLPVELLVETFKYATQCERTSLHDTTPLRKIDISPLLTLIAITHVCRRWRDVATGTPMLWNRFRSMPNDSLLKLFLERSGNAPLTVGIIVKNKGRKVVEGVLEGCRTRLQTLHIVDARYSYSRHPPLHERALQLRLVELLCCTIMSKSERRDRGAWPSNSSMPVLFGDTVSTLRALAIVPVAWLPGNQFSHLTHLYLSFSMHNGTSLVEQLRRLLTLLSRTAGLSYLQLRDVGQVRDPFSSDATFSQSSEPKRVALSHLRSLIIAESGLRTTLSFIGCLDLPRSVLVHLSGMDVNQDPTSIRIPTSPLLISLSRLELFAVKRSLHLVAGPSDAYDSSRPFRAGFWMQAKTYGEGQDWKPWLSELHTMLQPSSIRTLHVCFRDPELFATILPHMSHLVELGVLFSDSSVAVWEPCIKRLCAVLGDCEKITCPRLRVFCLETHVGPETMPCFSRITDMAAMRTHLGHPLRRVAIRAVLPWRPWEDQQGVAALFYGVFSRLGLYVETVEYRGAGDEPLCPFSMHRRWEAADADARRQEYSSQVAPVDPSGRYEYAHEIVGGCAVASVLSGSGHTAGHDGYCIFGRRRVTRVRPCLVQIQATWYLPIPRDQGYMVSILPYPAYTVSNRAEKSRLLGVYLCRGLRDTVSTTSGAKICPPISQNTSRVPCTHHR
ncbi:hypothetical protein C8Q74DRAFT_507751 [Fomes fomentarius]|nr:hypothetical protein C8Q74DRAFT_507751 [Fomes fomentarius]